MRLRESSLLITLKNFYMVSEYFDQMILSYKYN
jgi:hypothetical protein